MSHSFQQQTDGSVGITNVTDRQALVFPGILLPGERSQHFPQRVAIAYLWSVRLSQKRFRDQRLGKSDKNTVFFPASNAEQVPGTMATFFTSHAFFLSVSARLPSIPIEL